MARSIKQFGGNPRRHRSVDSNRSIGDPLGLVCVCVCLCVCVCVCDLYPPKPRQIVMVPGKVDACAILPQPYYHYCYYYYYYYYY